MDSPVPLLMLLTAVRGAFSTLAIPARQSPVFELVGREDLQSAIALNSSGFNFARLIGPAIGAGGYESLPSALGVGGVMGALMLAGPLSQVTRGPLLSAAAVVYPLLLLALVFTRDGWIALGLLPFVGTALITFNLLAKGILQTLVADEYRGRLRALYGLIIFPSQSAGALSAGAVARAFGVQWTVGGGAIITLGFAWYMLRKRPELRPAWFAAVVGSSRSATRGCSPAQTSRR